MDIKDDIITICIMLIIPPILGYSFAYSFIEYYEVIGWFLYWIFAYILGGLSGILAVYTYRALYIVYIIVRLYFIKRRLYRYVISRQINVLYNRDWEISNDEKNIETFSISMFIGNKNSVPDFIIKKSRVVELNILEKILNAIFKLFHFEYIATNIVYNIILTVKIRPKEDLYWANFYENGFYLFHDNSEYSILSEYLFKEQKKNFPVIVINKGIKKLFSAHDRFYCTSVNDFIMKEKKKQKQFMV